MEEWRRGLDDDEKEMERKCNGLSLSRVALENADVRLVP